MAKTGVLVGVTAFCVGLIAEVTLRSTGTLTPTLDTAFVTLEFAGPLVALSSLILFGIVLPLTEKTRMKKS